MYKKIQSNQLICPLKHILYIKFFFNEYFYYARMHENWSKYTFLMLYLLEIFVFLISENERMKKKKV